MGTAQSRRPSTGDASTPPPVDTVAGPDRTAARIAEGRAALGLDVETGKPVPPSAASKMPPPVYDARGNVRPRGTKGAKPMTYAERVAIAQRLAAGEVIVAAGEDDRPDDPADVELDDAG